MVPEPSFESMCFNLFLSNDSINDSNQNPDVNFHNDITSLETSYLSPSELDKNFQNFSKEYFSVLCLNMRSMNKKCEAYQDFCKSQNTKFSLICLRKTWVNDSNINQNPLPQLEGYNSVHKIKKSLKGRGIVIFMQDSLLYKLRNDLSIFFEDIESSSTEILNGQN